MKDLLLSASITLTALVAFAVLAYNYFPLSWLAVEKTGNFGAITEEAGTDTLKSFPARYNANLAQLMRMSTTSLPVVTTMSGLTSAASLATIGTITTGVWNGTDIAVAGGGTGVSSLTDNAVLIGSGTSAITALTVGTNGQLLIGDTSDDPAFATLNCDRSVTCTTGAGTLEIDADSELFTYAIAVNMFATSTADGMATTSDSGFLEIRVPIASTITEFNCYATTTIATSATSTIRARVTSNPVTGNFSDLLYTTGVRCGSDVYTSTTTFSATAISAGSVISFFVEDAEPTGNRPTVIYPSFQLTKDD